MLLVGQRVHDRKALAGGRQPQRLLLPERPQHQRVDPAFEVAGDVLERLADAFGELGRQVAACARPARARRSRTWSVCAATASRRAAPRACRRASPPSAPPVRAGDRPSSGGRASAAARARRDRDRGWRGSLWPWRPAAGRCPSAAGYVRYSPLIFTYSAVRSQVQTVASPPPPVPRWTSIDTSFCFRWLGGLRRVVVVRQAVLEQQDAADAHGGAIDVEASRRRGRRRRRCGPSWGRRRAPRS